MLGDEHAYQTTSAELAVRIQMRDTILLGLVGAAATVIGILVPLDPARQRSAIVIPFVVFIATLMIFHHDPMKKRPPIIAVVGAAACDADTQRVAHAVGAAVAASGSILLTGGRTGVMEAASAGASEAGGLVIGVLPGNTAAQANPYVGVPIVTGMGEARNVIIARTADGLIAVGGEYGTLSEIAFALKFAKPVVSIKSWRVDPAIAEETDPPRAVARLLEMIASRASPPVDSEE